MTQELLALLTLCILAPVQALLSATANAWVAGLPWGLGNRMTEPVFPDWAVRLKRAHLNLLENIGVFIGVVLIAHVLHVHDVFTVAAAWFFVLARVLFAGVYTLGITFLYVRTLIFFSSLAAIGVIVGRILAQSL